MKKIILDVRNYELNEKRSPFLRRSYYDNIKNTRLTIIKILTIFHFI